MDGGKVCEDLKSRIQSKSMYLGAETGLKHLQIYKSAASIINNDPIYLSSSEDGVGVW